MKQLITLSAALALALSTSAFANSHKEAPGMAASGAMTSSVMGDCEPRRRPKKLAGAAKTSLVSATPMAAPATAAARQGDREEARRAAKTSFVKKCETDAPSTMAACDAKAAEKKLAGAAKTSFTKKCMADA